MPAIVFALKAPSASEGKQAAYRLLHTVRARDGKVLAYVGRGLPRPTVAPALATSDALRPRFTVYADLAGERPLCSVVRPVPDREGGALLVLTPDGRRSGTVRSGSPRRGRRTRHTVTTGDGLRLVGREGTVASWAWFVLLSPLWLAINLAWMVGNNGEGVWSLPSRTAWRVQPDRGFRLSAMKYSGISGRYKVRTSALDLGTACAQAVLHREVAG
ncbi:hypothetical protein [Streptomyces sp. HB2AG]|uniref:hypothetical protein n=1 Tax=Streptomyces sp. HB2AG TaxID=2983400 RepID=UPI0022AA612E|nr:hypothetical protein [Streptomyces sp. HB2AG]MCZ2524851.1 hypothetical protein [Streptomyces sp. HB2AG]